MIEDIGTGIPRNVIEKIFEPFFTTKEVGKGTGLGLSVVYGIVKKHNGWINVYSEPGKGTIFKIYVPSMNKAVGEKTELTIADDAIHGNGERILLIEDEDDVKRFIASALRQYGYTPYEASNASEARSVFKSEKGKFDLIFSDVILPDKNGCDLVEELLSGKKDIPVIMCSGYTEEKVHQSIISKRVFQFIQKPFNILELLNIISSTIDLK
jgi:CheY-like chemotaxis protein